MNKDRGIYFDNPEDAKKYYKRFFGVPEELPCVTEEEMQKCKEIVKKYTPSVTNPH